MPLPTILSGIGLGLQGLGAVGSGIGNYYDRKAAEEEARKQRELEQKKLEEQQREFDAQHALEATTKNRELGFEGLNYLTTQRQMASKAARQYKFNNALYQALPTAGA